MPKTEYERLCRDWSSDVCSSDLKTDSREVHMTTTQIEDTATYPSKIVTKQQGGK
jgi:hypothetical protein